MFWRRTRFQGGWREFKSVLSMCKDGQKFPYNLFPMPLDLGAPSTTACPHCRAMGHGYATTIMGLWQHTVPGRILQPPMTAHRAVRRHWYFRKVLKIIKNLSSLFFKKNAAKEKKKARRRKYRLSSFITPSVGASFRSAKHPPSRDAALLAALS